MSSNTSASSYATTAAAAQADASNPSVAAEIRKNASEERKAAEAVAHQAQEFGQKLTGKPEGDADLSKVHESNMPTTTVKLDQVYTDEERAAARGQGHQGSGVASGITQAASDVYNKPVETLQAAKDTVVDKATAATEGVSHQATAAKDTLAHQASSAKDTVSNKTAATKDSATPAGSTTGESKGIISSVTDTASAAVNTVTAPIGKVAGAVGGMLGFGGSNQESTTTETKSQN